MQPDASVRPKGSSWRYALTALGLFVGFYAFALLVAGVLLGYVVWSIVEWKGHAGLGFVGAAGLAILRSIIPPRDRFEPPGPRLNRNEQPRLFAEIDDIAKRTGQKPPDEVYLVPAITAAVSQRGGLLGFFSRRVMILGLPLLHLLTTSQLRAVLAHELGHFQGGDTRLAGWLYITRMAIFRTGVEVHQRTAGLLSYPFEQWARFFLRKTRAMSIEQEFAADALAARTVGAEHLIKSLERIAPVQELFRLYLLVEYEPVVSAGFCPPLLDGFSRFYKNVMASSKPAPSSAPEPVSEDEELFETHPPLEARAAAVRALGIPAMEQRDEPAIELLADVAESEQQILSDILSSPGQPAPQLQPISWYDVTRRVYLPAWQQAANQARSRLPPLTIGELHLDHASWAQLYTWLTAEPPYDWYAAVSFASTTVAQVIAVCLVEKGWHFESSPGQPVIFTNGEVSVSPFTDLSNVVDGQLTAEAFRRKYEEAGLNGLRLR